MSSSFVPSQPAATARRILLVCPPFQHLNHSSLATARLATFVRAHGGECVEAYLHFDLARLLGRDRYEKATEAELGAELLFAEALHADGDHDRLPDPAEDALARCFGDRAARRSVLAAFEARCIAQMERHRPDIVGVTTSYNQLVPALWLARVIKRTCPTVRIALGGTACAEPMGRRILDAYPDVDWVVDGDGEHPLLALARGEQPERLVRSPGRIALDELPMTDYGAYLAQAGEFDHPDKIWLSFESSRGCWWGQKIHCPFCGLHRRQMRFEEKASPLVLDEVRTLWDRYHRRLLAVDGILSMRHLKEVAVELARAGDGPPLFYEIKANLTQADVVTLRRANIRRLQPGIESLSSHLLALLRKGTNAIHNLALLKWCREQHMTIGWNQLYGIPGEQTADYETQIALMETIPQLAPPYRINPIRLDRYSPYFEHHREHGWTDARPAAEYRLLHPQLGEAALREFAYHFDGIGGPATGAYAERFGASVARWRQRYVGGDGLFLDPADGLFRRTGGQATRCEVGEAAERLIDGTHDVVPISRALERARCDRPLMDDLARRGIVFVEGEKVVNLVVRTERPGG